MIKNLNNSKSRTYDMKKKIVEETLSMGNEISKVK